MDQTLRKPLHEYRRDFTDEELDTIARLHAEKKSNRAIARELDITDGRVATALKRLDVMEATNRLRMTSMVPEMLDRLLIGIDKLMATALNVESRQTALEREMRAMNRAIYLGKLRTNTLRERNRTLQEEIKEL